MSISNPPDEVCALCGSRGGLLDMFPRKIHVAAQVGMHFLVPTSNYLHLHSCVRDVNEYLDTELKAALRRHW